MRKNCTAVTLHFVGAAELEELLDGEELDEDGNELLDEGGDCDEDELLELDMQ